MKRLVLFDFDATLINSPEKEEGMGIWKEKTGRDYPHIGWWGRKESLDTTIFDIKPFPQVLAQLNKEKATPDTMTAILTSRMEKLRPEVENVLKLNNIVVDDLLLKSGNKDKGDVILDIVRFNPDIEEIIVYDDCMNGNEEKINEYTKITDLLPKSIKYSVYFVNDGIITGLHDEEIFNKIINEEIEKMFNDDYIYHGTSKGAAIHIQNHGGMKINAVNNNEPFISFTSDIDVANYYAKMKGGSDRGVVLRTKRTKDFSLSPKFEQNNGHEWITSKEIPVTYLVVQIKSGWIPLINWDFINDKKIS